MKMSKLLAVLLFWSYLGFSQNVIKYNYVVNGKSDSDRNKPFLGMEYEFSTIRKYYSQTEFKESRLFTGSNDSFIFYKIINQVWYYKTKNKWNLFFDYNRKQGGYIRLLGNNYKIKFEKEIIIRNKKLYKIVLRPTNVILAHNPAYLFDP